MTLWLSKAVMEMAQRQKAQQVEQPPPPSGPNGELRFQPDTQNVAQEQNQGEKNQGIPLRKEVWPVSHSDGGVALESLLVRLQFLHQAW